MAQPDSSNTAARSAEYNDFRSSTLEVRANVIHISCLILLDGVVGETTSWHAICASAHNF